MHIARQIAITCITDAVQTNVAWCKNTYVVW